MRRSELTLLGHLSDPDSLDTLAREGFGSEVSREVIPTDWVRRVVDWALKRFFADGRRVAPSREAVMETWADTLERHEVELPDPDVEIDTIGWVIDDLRSNNARVGVEKHVVGVSTEMGSADSPEWIRIANEHGDKYNRFLQSLVSRRHEADGYEGVRDSMTRLNDVMVNGRVDRGMHLGLDLIDAHMHGIHPGEICVVCSESSVGKSWLAGFATLTSWRRGRKALLVTLENDTDMTYDRLACMACGIPYEDYQTGQVADQQIKALFLLLNEMEHSQNRPIITQIDPSQRTMSGIVRKAQLEGADDLIIDQLSFVRPEKDAKAQQRNFQVSEIMHQLKELVNESSIKIPVLLFVQINREGAAAAAKEGRYQKRHLAESSGVEQTADFLWAIYQSHDMKIEGTVQFQCLKARRVVEKHFEFYWQPFVGVVHGLGEIDLTRQATG